MAQALATTKSCEEEADSSVIGEHVYSASSVTTKSACFGGGKSTKQKPLNLDFCDSCIYKGEIKGEMKSDSVNEKRGVVRPCAAHRQQSLAVSEDLIGGFKNTCISHAKVPSNPVKAAHDAYNFIRNFKVYDVDTTGVYETYPLFILSCYGRVHTFNQRSNWPIIYEKCQKDPKTMAAAGFYRIDHGVDQVRCVFCHMILGEWLPYDNPFLSHWNWAGGDTNNTCEYISTLKEIAPHLFKPYKIHELQFEPNQPLTKPINM